MIFVAPPQTEPPEAAPRTAPYLEDLGVDFEDDVEDESFSDLFTDPEDGAFDASRFLRTRTGFLPLVLPVTEPAVGYGAAAGLLFFHGTPTARPSAPGEPERLQMPSATAVFGMATENGSWATGFGHLGMWDGGRVRYLGGAGYGSFELDWFGKGDSLQRSFDYQLEGAAVVQQLNVQLGDSDFFAGVRQRFFVADAQFDPPSLGLGIVPDEFQSKTSGLGAGITFDSRDQPFCPRRGSVADVTYLQYASALGGDFDYGRLEVYFIHYFPLAAEWTLGLNAGGQFSSGDVPFYDLARISMRGVAADQFMDDDVVQLEGELRWDFLERWSAVTFGGVGRVADSISGLDDDDGVWSAGAGFRYLLARQFGMRIGLDVARSPDDTAVYLTIGTGWFRP